MLRHDEIDHALRRSVAPPDAPPLGTDARQSSPGPLPGCAYTHGDCRAWTSVTLIMAAHQMVDLEVLEAWAEVGDLDQRGVSRLQKRTLKAQPDLLAFAMSFTEGMRDDVRSVGVYILHCIIQVFQRSMSSVGRVSEQAILSQWPLSVARVNELGSSLLVGGSAASFVASSPQPRLSAAIVGALAEDDDPDDQVEMSGDEFCHLLAVLDAAVVTLHAASVGRPLA